jgi:sialic acid synthase SpsE
MSTPFDEESADFLETLDVPVFKIPSGEITNLPFLAHVARKNRPIILSTGMSFLGEVETAVKTITAAGNRRLALLHCVSNYPADPADTNLRVMGTLSAAFQFPVGYSDHTPGIEISLAATALGACIIEKHFTLDRSMPGPDHQASLEPSELNALVAGVRMVEKSLGHGRKEPAASEANTAAVARKSLVASHDIPAETLLTEEMITIKRPGTGLPPSLRSFAVGRRARTAIPEGALITLEMLS